MKFLKALFVLAIALSLTASASYAETQSVKVSGDITMRGILRDAYDYRGSTHEAAANADTRTGTSSVTQNWWMTNAGVQVDADLTDNVSTCIRIINDRDWNVRTKSVANITTLYPYGAGGYGSNTTDSQRFDVELNLAYLTLKNFIYSPLTVTIGRQNLWFGQGFIVGSNQVANVLEHFAAVNLIAPEYSQQTAFDAIKAVLDYDPWTITGVYAKIWGNAVRDRDDVDLYGLNFGYKFNQYNAEAEAYTFIKTDRQVDNWQRKDATNDVYTVGLRGSVEPFSFLTLAGEGAWQGGTYTGRRMQDRPVKRSAFGLDFSAECRYFADKLPWKPKVGAEYVLYSGDNNADTLNQDQRTSPFTGWDLMYRGKTFSRIREYVGAYYFSAEYPALTNYIYNSADASFTNQHTVMFTGSLQPIESLTLKGTYDLFWLDSKKVLYRFTNRDAFGGSFIGQEVDLEAIWDYTEDVSFGILGAFFAPNKDVYKSNNKVASDIVGSVKVSF